MEMYFRNESKKAPWPLTLPGCPHRCPLQDFLSLTESVVPKDWQQECQLASGPADTGKLLPVLVLGLSPNNFQVKPIRLENSQPSAACPPESTSHLQPILLSSPSVMLSLLVAPK